MARAPAARAPLTARAPAPLVGLAAGVEAVASAPVAVWLPPVAELIAPPICEVTDCMAFCDVVPEGDSPAGAEPEGETDASSPAAGDSAAPGEGDAAGDSPAAGEADGDEPPPGRTELTASPMAEVALGSGELWVDLRLDGVLGEDAGGSEEGEEGGAHSGLDTR